jgi:protocatechuate 3,4-dioxygenase beta subunit
MKRHFINLDPIDDDTPRGRVLSRREALRLFGSIGGAALLAGTGVVRLLAQEATAEATATVAPSCVVKPELTEGPYFVDEMLNRSDIRIEPSDGSVKEGMLLNLIFHVTDVTNANACVPLPGAQVDVWQCDALGVYSDVSEAGFDTVGLKFLRGYQITDDMGRVEFTTIIPGWYSGRTTHIHFKIRTDPESDSGYEFTSQLFLDDALTDAIYEQAPYNEETGARDTYNTTDMHYANGGDQLLLAPTLDDDGSYTAEFSIGLDLNDEEVGASDSFSMGGGGAPGGQPPQR